MTLKLFTFLRRRRHRFIQAERAPKAGARRNLVTLAAVLFVLGSVAHAAPALAEKATLSEQSSADPQGKHYTGSVTWQVERERAKAGVRPQLELRADITIPERKMTVSLVLSRNTDRSLQATHTMDVMFKLPADFSGRGIANLVGVVMKPNEQARGTPLADAIAKVTDGFFLIGLSELEGDRKLNADILRDGKWIDILVIYGDGTHAIVSAEKGPSGEQAFAEAFAAWGK